MIEPAVRSWAWIVGLALAVAALASWVYYKPASSGDETYPLTELKATAVSRVRVERPATKERSGAAETVQVEKHESEWRMTAPIAARAERFQIERLMSILQARSSVRYAASELARFGLDHPAAVLTLADQAFTFGSINATTREQYVMTGGYVYLVPLGYTAALPRNTDALLARSLFAPTEAPARFDLPGFTLALEDGTWAVAPAMPDVGADERNAWVDAWRHANAISVARHTGAEAAGEIKVQLKDGRTIALGIVQREPELILVRTDENVEYHFVAEVGRRLLAPPRAARSERSNK